LIIHQQKVILNLTKINVQKIDFLDIRDELNLAQKWERNMES